MTHNSIINCRPAVWVTIILTMVVTASATAETSSSKQCDVHAVAMVAEMKATTTHPMSEQEVALVRETAMKSCLAQLGANPNSVTSTPSAVVAAGPAPASVVAVTAPTSDSSFFGTLGALLGGSSPRKPGNQRLLERSQH